MKTALLNSLCLLSILLAFSSLARDSATPSSSKITAYVQSESFSNILPIKQLLEDDWKQAPATDSSHGFTQNEIGINVLWNNINFGIARRLDYFVFTNPDTATAFYLERNDIPLTSQESYQLALKLHHQESHGIRLGYQWQHEKFSVHIQAGYWDVDTTRESQINGEIFGQENNNITGTAQLSEFYSSKNFLKRPNNDKWQTDGSGITVDLAIAWQIHNQLNLNLDIKDLYSSFKLDGLGYSEGKVDTEGTFINSVGGKSYLPLYRGLETTKDYRFDLPAQISFVGLYQPNNLNKSLGYLLKYKRQGEVDFYYLGAQWSSGAHKTQLLLDLENTSPELHYQNQWLNLTLGLDEIDIDKAMQINFGLAVSYPF